MSPDISKVCTPENVRGSGLDPLCFNVHFLHVCSDCPLCDVDVGFTEFSCEFRSIIVLVGLAINLLDKLFARFLSLAGNRYRAVKESMVTRM